MFFVSRVSYKTYLCNFITFSIVLKQSKAAHNYFIEVLMLLYYNYVTCVGSRYRFNKKNILKQLFFFHEGIILIILPD